MRVEEYWDRFNFESEGPSGSDQLWRCPPGPVVAGVAVWTCLGFQDYLHRLALVLTHVNSLEIPTSVLNIILRVDIFRENSVVDRIQIEHG
jgi:hypothetical protein